MKLVKSAALRRSMDMYRALFRFAHGPFMRISATLGARNTTREPPFLRNRFSSRTYATAQAGLTQRNGSVMVPGGTLDELEAVLCHKFKDRSLLVQAMTHRSMVNKGLDSGTIRYRDEEGRAIDVKQNNERLEVLGDKVFGLLIIDKLYKRDSYSEGEISTVAHSLLSGKAMDNYCRTLRLSPFLIESENIRGKPGYRYGDFVEALMGALFLDGGFPAAQSFFSAKITPLLDSREITAKAVQCEKQKLQEYLLGLGLSTASLGTRLQYKQVRADYDKQIFTQGIELFGRRVSVATASNRISADQAAASRLLDNLMGAKATCFLIRMARQAKDHGSLKKLQATRALEIEANNKEKPCPASAM